MTSVADRHGWEDRAACLAWPDWDEWADYQALLDICHTCPVRQPCLDTAMRLGTGGVRGGTTARQRRKMGGRNGPGDLTGWIRMVDGRPDRPLSSFHAWWLEHGTNEYLPSINPVPPDRRDRCER